MYELIKKINQNDSSGFYQFSSSAIQSPLSVLSVDGTEHLSELWQYRIRFTCAAVLRADELLNRSAKLVLVIPDKFRFTLEPMTREMLNAKTLFNTDKILYGVITTFNRLSSSRDEVTYEAVLSPKLALLENQRQCRIFQQRSVPEIVDIILREHQFTGIDFEFHLTDTYPRKEFVTQWQESDLGFIQRILADVGIWFRFENHDRHPCNRVMLGDSEQNYLHGLSAPYREPSGLSAHHQDSVWEIQVSSQVVPQRVKLNDYNYRTADASLLIEVNSQPTDLTTYGTHYTYGEHYPEKGTDENYAAVTPTKQEPLA